MGVVHVRLFGEKEDIEEVVRLISKAYPSRFLNPLKNTRDPGWRVFGDVEVVVVESRRPKS